ncbi:MAG: transposase [Candidatus Sericytochromatia bacterium]
MYTTNPIESFRRQIRKVSKSKSIFGSETWLFKLLFLVTQNISKKWNLPVHNCTFTLFQLHIKFVDRLKFNF